MSRYKLVFKLLRRDCVCILEFCHSYTLRHPKSSYEIKSFTPMAKPENPCRAIELAHLE